MLQAYKGIKINFPTYNFFRRLITYIYISEYPSKTEPPPHTFVTHL